MLPDEIAWPVIVVTLSVCAIVMPLAYVAKHRWHNLGLTRSLSAVGIISALILMVVGYSYLPD